jgi:hypothetical protein
MHLIVGVHESIMTPCLFNGKQHVINIPDLDMSLTPFVSRVSSDLSDVADAGARMNRSLAVGCWA